MASARLVVANSPLDLALQEAGTGFRARGGGALSKEERTRVNRPMTVSKSPALMATDRPERDQVLP